MKKCFKILSLLQNVDNCHFILCNYFKIFACKHFELIEYFLYITIIVLDTAL